MKLWVDDEKDPLMAELFDLEPGDWMWVKTVAEARTWLFPEDGFPHVDVLALDNDLGWMSLGEEGLDIARALLNRVLDDPSYTPPAVMTCISRNPIAAVEIRATFADIRRVLRERGVKCHESK